MKLVAVKSQTDTISKHDNYKRNEILNSDNENRRMFDDIIYYYLLIFLIIFESDNTKKHNRIVDVVGKVVFERKVTGLSAAFEWFRGLSQ